MILTKANIERSKQIIFILQESKRMEYGEESELNNVYYINNCIGYVFQPKKVCKGFLGAYIDEDLLYAERIKDDIAKVMGNK